VWLPWREAMERALYGVDGFYRRPGQPAAHFRTSVHASPRFGAAVAELLRRVDTALGHPDPVDFVDLGAGGGELSTVVSAVVTGDLARRLRVTAVDLVARPPGVDSRIAWRAELPGEITGLVFANEWLDNVPVDVVELTADGPRLVLVDPATGEETLGATPEVADLAWLDRWWPLRSVGDRAEVGRSRDLAWAGVVRRVRRGLAVAVDYPLVTRPAGGTLTGYRNGRQVRPVPDGRCDITAHVALDSCAAGGPHTVVTSQRDALLALGVRAVAPDPELAETDPAGYLRALRDAGQAAELIDTTGLGAFGWLAQSPDLPVAELLKPLSA
jgi:SAM-dependent MidA family methyltransferase